MEAAISTTGLTKSFGSTVALDHLDLEIETGAVFGYLGPNGAGKSTTLRLLMGLLRPTSGSAQILGLDVRARREDVHRQVGYLPGSFVADPHLTGHEYLAFVGALRGGVDHRTVAGLCERFEVDPGRRFGEHSRGNRQKLGLVQAFMHAPPVLVLDEPTSGLDPLMQREFASLVRERSAEGATILLSSHILSEVGEIAESVGIIRAGRLVVVDSVEALQHKAAHRIDLDFCGEVPDEVLRRIPGVRDVSVVGTVAHVLVEGSTEQLLRVAAPYGIENVVTHEGDLEHAFLGYYQPEVAR